jgi:outer membrane lipoprotein carrier protein
MLMRPIGAVLFIITIIWSLPAVPGSKGADSLDRFFREVSTFAARFEQIVLDEGLNQIEESGGRMTIKRPGRFRWDYDPPLEQKIISDGDKVWIHDIDLEQVTVRPLVDTLGKTPATILAGKGNISENYLVTDLGHYGKLSWVGLQSKQEDSAFSDMRIGFENGYLRVLELVDNLGQTTRITFLESVENPLVSDESFAFVPPRGVDVIDQTKNQN